MHVNDERYADIAASLNHEIGTLSTQIARKFKELIESGALKPGDKIPASRALSSLCGVSRGTAVTAIEVLVAEGLLVARASAGTFVSEEAMLLYERSQPAKTSQIASYPSPVVQIEPDVDCAKTSHIDFRPCRPSMELFPTQAWRRCLSQAATHRPVTDYGDPQGELELREEIASYLRRARGLATSATNIIITNGAVHAMHILSALYLNSSSNVVVENPGYPLARQTFELTGARIHCCNVDENGLVVDELVAMKKSVDFVYVTPSHQFPTGSRLSLGRRHQLVEWAHHKNSLIIEDDYDGEFRYDVPPLAPMAAMAPDVVIYCGTFSKTLFPGLRIGFAVAPEPLVKTMAEYRTVTEYAPNTITQRALTRFIANGQFERHVQRMRRIYSAKRKKVAEVLASISTSARISGLDSGLSALIDIDNRFNARSVSQVAATQNILVPCLSRYVADNSRPRNALVLGYAEPSLSQIAKGVDFIARNT